MMDFRKQSQKQDDLKLEASLGYIVSPGFPGLLIDKCIKFFFTFFDIFCFVLFYRLESQVAWAGLELTRWSMLTLNF